MDKDLIKQSALYLKQAVPLMMKYQVPTTPINYALWYRYVEKATPLLNEKMDKMMQEHQVCPVNQTQSLYREYVADNGEADGWALRQSVEKMLIEVGQSITDTQQDTEQFQHKFDNAFREIDNVEEAGLGVEEVMLLLKKLQGESKQIHQSTDFLQQSLQRAQKEIESLKTQLKKTEQQALYDSLTGLYNRHAFDTELTNYLSKQADGLCLILLDIDHFKKFNDEWGHLLGDQVLKAVGRKVNDACRDGNTAYRFGGEEFAVLLPKSQLRLARHFAESLRKLIEKLSLKDKRSGQLINNISASFGVAEYEQGQGISDLIATADKHLYEAKRLGRNRVLPM